MTTFLIVWTFQLFTAKPTEDPVPLEFGSESTGAAPSLTDEAKAALDPTFVEAAEKTEKDGLAPEFFTLGSLDPTSPYRMLATFSNRGAALARIELNEEKYVDNNDATGYLGQIVVDESLAWIETDLGLPGVEAQVVGVGTPAALAGLKAGDRIVGVVRDGAEPVEIASFDGLRDELLKTKPGDKIRLEVLRGAALAESAPYRALKDASAAAMRSLETVPFLGASNETAKPAESAAPEAEAPAAESEAVASNETSEPAESASPAAESEAVATNEDAAKPAPFGETFAKETLEVALQKAPLAVVRPSGLVKDYADYVNLAGLQGAVRGDVGAFELLTAEDGKRKLNADPASFLTTLAAVDGDRLTEWAAAVENPARGSAPRPAGLAKELPGVDMRDGYWEYVAEESSADAVVFRKRLLERRLEIVKKYALVPEELPASGRKATDGRGYHLTLSLEIRNFDPNAKRSVSYLLDGPTGLALEGAWFSAGRKTGPGWGAYGLRDLVVGENDGKKFDVIKCWDVAEDKARRSDETDVDFLGVDGQYFQCSAIPLGDAAGAFAYAPIRVGARVKERPNFADVSFRLRSADVELAPRGQAGDSLKREFEIFAGPKRPDVLAAYDLSETLVYGWFWFVSIPLLWILHFFHDYLVFNYGIAIVMLTILVRLCLFPLSRKQVASSLKMQKLQPELTAMREKYKDKPQEMMAAQQALFKRHGVNPLSGCLPIFIQMPIFIGLYKALSLDVNLYGAPLFSRGARWCSNLAAPDMAFDWSGFWNSIGWPDFNMAGQGFLSMFCLGPYLNILPVITIALFLIQQKILMPPVVGDDEQAQQQRMMRRMMNFMMIFMGFMFFKVPSGLCVYFIVSSLWGLLERKMLPKADLNLNAEAAPVVAETVGGASSVAGFESKRDRRKAFAATGRSYEIYERKRDKKGRRVASTKVEPPKSKFRAWWDEIVEKAQEQQRLAKAEAEDRSAFSRKKRRRG